MVKFYEKLESYNERKKDKMKGHSKIERLHKKGQLDFHQELVRYGKIVADEINDEENYRKTLFFYGGYWCGVKMEKGSISQTTISINEMKDESDFRRFFL